MNNWAFWGCPCIPNHNTLICYQLTCLPVECSKQVFLSIPQLPSLKLPLSQLFWNMLQQIQNNVTKNTVCYKTEHLISCMCIQWNIGCKWFANHCILFLFTFHIVSQLFWHWGCTSVCTITQCQYHTDWLFEKNVNMFPFKWHHVYACTPIVQEQPSVYFGFSLDRSSRLILQEWYRKRGCCSAFWTQMSNMVWNIWSLEFESGKERNYKMQTAW